MTAVKYGVISFEDFTRFEFLSEGPKGTIKKVVHYQLMAAEVYNLAFGDWNDDDQRIADLVRSNNDDKEKVLATVAFTVIEFMHHHPTASVFVQGSTAGRTRLYQMGIKANWVEISNLLTVEGYRMDFWEIFSNAENYDAFLVRAKRSF